MQPAIGDAVDRRKRPAKKEKDDLSDYFLGFLGNVPY